MKKYTDVLINIALGFVTLVLGGNIAYGVGAIYNSFLPFEDRIYDLFFLLVMGVILSAISAAFMILLYYIGKKIRQQLKAVIRPPKERPDADINS